MHLHQVELALEVLHLLDIILEVAAEVLIVEVRLVLVVTAAAGLADQITQILPEALVQQTLVAAEVADIRQMETAAPALSF